MSIDFGNSTGYLRDGTDLGLFENARGHPVSNVTESDWDHNRDLDFTLVPIEELDPNDEAREDKVYSVEEALNTMEMESDTKSTEAVSNWRNLIKKIDLENGEPSTKRMRINDNHNKLKGPIRKQILQSMLQWWNHHEDTIYEINESQPKVFWEIFAGEARTATTLNNMGVITSTFGLPQWDFLRSEDRRELLKRLDSEKPDEVLISPPCRKWSKMQNVNQRTDHQVEQLWADRNAEHGTFLLFTRTILNKQHRANRHAHVEHPAGSLAWSTLAFKDMPGVKVTFPQCAHGLRHPTTDEPILKMTTFHTTKPSMVKFLAATCTCTVPHAKLEGHVAGIGSLTRWSEDYPPQLARRIAEGVLYGGPMEHVYPADDG